MSLLNLTRVIFIVLAMFLVAGCKKSRVNRQLPGTWVVTKHRITDQFGFKYDCNGSGSLDFGNCKKGDCDYTFNFSSTCPSTSYIWQEYGTYKITDKGDNFELYRENPDGSIDTFNYHIYLLTNTDLKVDFYDASSKTWHLFVFEQ